MIKRFIKINLIIITIGVMMISMFLVEAGTRTGHEEFTDIYFRYQPDAQLLVQMNSEKLNQMMKKVKRKAFGWSTYTNIVNTEVIYESDMIFSRANKTDQEIKFNYLATSSKTKQINKSLTGTLALKASGKIDTISAGLDASIRGEIGYSEKTIFEEEFEFNVIIKPGKKISLIVKGVATLSNGASKYYFLGISTNQKYWEYIDVVNEYYELREEDA